MNHMFDVDRQKQQLRVYFTKLRKEMDDKEKRQRDSLISMRFLQTDEYLACQKLFIYLALEQEIETRHIIEDAWKREKQVYIPRCIPGQTGKMEFYQLTGWSSLKMGAYHLWEPDIMLCQKTDDFQNGICVVPGLAFDTKGYRLGYGKGYYDRFLKKFFGKTVGLCYNNHIVPKLPHDKYDFSVQYVLTEEREWCG